MLFRLLSLFLLLVLLLHNIFSLLLRYRRYPAAATTAAPTRSFNVNYGFCFTPSKDFLSRSLLRKSSSPSVAGGQRNICNFCSIFSPDVFCVFRTTRSLFCRGSTSTRSGIFKSHSLNLFLICQLFVQQQSPSFFLSYRPPSSPSSYRRCRRTVPYIRGVARFLGLKERSKEACSP